MNNIASCFTKSLKPISLTEECIALLQNHQQRTFYTIFAKDFDGITIHSVRRTFATHMCANGVAMTTTAKIMGHTDTRMIAEIYNQPLFDTLLTAMQKYETALKKIQLLIFTVFAMKQGFQYITESLVFPMVRLGGLEPQTSSISTSSGGLVYQQL